MPATPDRWNDVVDVFGTRGDPATCWCQFFRVTGSAWADADPRDLRGDLERQVREGPHPPGLLAYAGDAPVGWVALGPRPGYARLRASRGLRGVTGDDLEDEGVWSVTCFVVPVPWRRRGVSRALLDGAVTHARSAGARILEAQPVDVAARTGRVPGSELYHGAASTFLAAGFTEVGRTAPTRPVLRLAL